MAVLYLRTVETRPGQCPRILVICTLCRETYVVAGWPSQYGSPRRQGSKYRAPECCSTCALKATRAAIERRAGLAARRARIVDHVEHDQAHVAEVALAMNGMGRYAPQSANAASRGARRVFARPASAYDEPLVATSEVTDAAQREDTCADTTSAAPSVAGPGLAKTSG